MAQSRGNIVRLRRKQTAGQDWDVVFFFYRRLSREAWAAIPAERRPSEYNNTYTVQVMTVCHLSSDECPIFDDEASRLADTISERLDLIQYRAE